VGSLAQNHSTETALVQLLDSIYHAADNGKATLLFSLDLSIAFDITDHLILLRRLADSVGLTGFALTWIQSLIGRSQAATLLTPLRVSLAFPRLCS